MFGNPYVRQDSLALEVGRELTDHEVIFANKPEDILKVQGEFFILDVVEGIKEVELIEDISRLKIGKIVTAHDFDLGLFLKLLQQTGKIKKIRIIGVPTAGDVQAIKADVLKLLSKL